MSASAKSDNALRGDADPAPDDAPASGIRADIAPDDGPGTLSPKLANAGLVTTSLDGAIPNTTNLDEAAAANAATNVSADEANNDAAAEPSVTTSEALSPGVNDAAASEGAVTRSSNAGEGTASPGAAEAARAKAAAELAQLSAWRLAAEVSDVPGAPPEDPLALVAALLAPRSRGLVEEQTVALRQEAGNRLAALLGIDADEARAVGASAQSALTSIGLADARATRDAALTLAAYAQRLAAPIGIKEPSEQSKAKLALSQRGAREIAGYAAAHPRAKLSALEAAGHVSHSTLQRRLVQLESAGVMRNAGTQMRPLWQVAGVERDPEDELTERQQKVLSLMRQDPPAKTPEIARAIGTSTATVFATYHELAALGLADKSANKWVAVPRREVDETR